MQRFTRAVLLLCVAAFALSHATVARYTVDSVVTKPNGVEAILLSDGSDPNAISPLLLQCFFRTRETLHFKITDPNNERWEVPDVVLENDPAEAPEEVDYDIRVLTDSFGLIITRKQTGEVLFDLSSFVYHDQYIEIGTRTVPDPYLYGLGERVERLRLNTDRTYTLFNTDHPTPELKPLYGSQPFYLEKRATGSHALLFLNSNAMDVTISPDPNSAVTFKTVGGVVDIYMFLGPNPEQAIRQYHAVIGHPRLHPYWVLGFHQCRYGYVNLTAVEEVVRQFNANQLPLDSMWVDIDYMDRFKIFTTDPVNYPEEEFRKFSQDLKEENKRLFLIIDPGVKVEENYDVYEDGLAKGIYVKDPYNSSLPSFGKVWPRACAFPDFTNPETEDFWKFHLQEFHNKVEYGGMWIDMNEAASFCDGRCIIDVKVEEDRPDIFSCECAEQYPYSKYNEVPEYLPGGEDARPIRSDSNPKLDRGSLHMESKYYLGTEYNLHNMYGHYESKVTKSSYESLYGERSAVITRATFPGTGRYAGHWLGDNESKYVDLKDSITGIINFNLYGIPIVGADVCGFIGATTEELCIRWMQLGIFYTFYRNHNAINEISQEPYVFSDSATAINRESINIRYRFLPYFYTLLYKLNVNGGTMIRPLFFNYPEDKNTWDIDSQLMINDNLLVTPVLTEGARSVAGYFPAGHTYYDWYTGAKTSDGSAGRYVTLNAPLSVIPIHVREGSIIPLQKEALNSVEARKLPYSLAIAVSDKMDSFSGELYLDDGLALTVSEENTRLITFVMRRTSRNSFTLTSSSVGSYNVDNDLEKIVFYGFQNQKLTINGVSGSVESDNEKLVIRLENVKITRDLNIQVVAETISEDKDDDDDDNVALIVGLSVGAGATALVAGYAVIAVRNKRSGYSGI